jgi:hypothetical protein
MDTTADELRKATHEEECASELSKVVLSCGRPVQHTSQSSAPSNSRKTSAIAYDSLMVVTSEENSNPSFVNQLISTFRCSHSHTNIPDNTF